MRFPLIISFMTLLSVALFPFPSTLACARQDSRAAFEAGQSAQERGDLASAIKHYSTAIAAEPSLFQAYYQRAIAQLGLGREEAAEADLKKVIDLQPGFARAHRALGLIYLDRDRTDDARRELAKALELDPKLSGVRLEYASALLKAGETQPAAEQLRAAIASGEANSLTYALLGVAGERLGKLDEAFAYYTRAIEIDPNNAPAREGRARLYEQRREFAKAIEDYTIAYRAQPWIETARRLARLHSLAGQPQAAIQLYRRLVLEKPEDSSLRAEMARVLLENGQVEEAVKEAEILERVQPKSAGALLLAGDIFFKEKPDVSAGYYRRAVELDPASNRARVQLAASLVRSQQYEAALPVLGEALSREPDNYAAHANLATALFKLKQYPQAAREFMWVLRARPDIPASYYFLAISLDRMGDCEQALRAYQEFVRKADANANKSEVEDANIRLGLLHKLAKDGKCKTINRGSGK